MLEVSEDGLPTVQVHAPPSLDIRLECARPGCKHARRLDRPATWPWFGPGLFVLLAPVREDDVRLFELWETCPRPAKDGDAFRTLGKLRRVPRDASAPPADADTFRKAMDWSSVDVHLVLHPSRDAAWKVLDQANKGELEARPLRARLEGVSLGADRRDDYVALCIDDDAQPQVPLLGGGPELYGGYTLYEHDHYRHLPRVAEQLLKLQLHLGALRYPVGDHAHPYVPAAASLRAFDVLTWNALLAFLRDAATGKGFLLEDGTQWHRAVLFHADLAPREDLAEWVQQKSRPPHRCIDPRYTRALARGDDGVDVPDGRYDGELDLSNRDDPAPLWVGEVEAKAIRAWLDGGFRKPGPILVSRSTGHRDHGLTCARHKECREKRGAGEGWFEWMRPELAARLDRWDELVYRFTAHNGVAAGHVYRSIRDGVSNTREGVASLSIHKSGLASDMLMHKYVDFHDQFPVRYVLEHVHVKEKSRDVSRVAWGLYCQTRLDEDGLREAIRRTWPGLKPDEVQARLAALVKDRITPWTWDPTSPDGGSPQASAKGPWVNVTELGKAAGLSRIQAWAEGWYLGKGVKLRGAADFSKIVDMLNLIVEDEQIKQRMAVISDPREQENVTVRVDEMQASVLLGWRDTLKSWRRPKGQPFEPEPTVTCRSLGALLALSDAIAYHAELPPHPFAVCCHDGAGNVTVEARGSELLRALSPTLSVEIRPDKAERDDAGFMAQWVGPAAENRTSGTYTPTGLGPGGEVKLLPLGQLAALVARMETENSALQAGRRGPRTYLVRVLDKQGQSPAATAKQAVKVRANSFRNDLDGVPSWRVEVTPRLAKYALVKDMVVSLPRRGVPEPQEWWHFQAADLLFEGGDTSSEGRRRRWSELLGDIGFTREGLRRIGYTAKDLTEKAY